MIEIITITAKSELKVSKNKRTYFTIGDERDRTFVCFKPALHSDLQIGTATQIDFSEPAKEGDSYKLNDIAREGEFPPRPESSPTKKYGRDEDRVDQRTFVMETGQDLRAGIIDKKHAFAKARETILASWVNLKVERESNAPVPQVTEVPKLTTIDIDEMNWLSESIKKIWGTYKAFVQFLGERYSVAKDGSVKNVMDRLTQPQQAELLKEIEGRLSKVS